MTKRSKVLATSLATIAMSASLVVGGTFALFTSESEVNIAVTAGTVKIEATAKDLDKSDLYSGQAAINGGTVSIENMLPGDSVTFEVEVTNYSTVTAQYRTILTSENGGLADALTVTFEKANETEISFLGGYGVDKWETIEAASEGGEVVETITVTIAFNSQGDEIDNLYQGKDCSYKVYVEAVQGNAETVNPLVKDENETSNNSDTYYINSEEGMRLMTAVANATPAKNAANNNDEFFLDFVLTADLDMSGYAAYIPSNRVYIRFNGLYEGKVHTISNLTVGANEAGRSALFSHSAKVENVRLENMTVSGEQAGLIVAYAEGNEISNVTIAGNNTVNHVDGGLEEWDAIGAFVGVNHATISGITLEDGAKITVNYNDMETLYGEGYQADSFGGHFGSKTIADTAVTNNGTITTTGVWYATIADGFAIAHAANGEVYYAISNANGMKYFAKSVNDGDSNYKDETVKLTANIDLENEAWTPIGLNADSAVKFYGTFDGQEKTISNLYINRTEGKYTASGLFGATGGTLKNFTISGAKVNALSGGEATDNGIAVVAGSFYATGTAENVHVKDATVTGNRYIGGIVGYFSGKVANCSVENVKLTATPDNLTGSYDNGDKVGGIVGYVNSSGTIENCEVEEATIVGYRDLGGIVGAGYSTTVLENTVSNSSITVDWTKYYEDKDQNAAEIIGRVLTENGTVDASNTYNNNNVIVNLWTGVMVTAEKLANNEVAFENGKTYHFVHDFPNEVVINLPAEATITLDGALATFEKNVKIVCYRIADGMDYVYPTTQPTFGQYTIKNFTVNNSLSIGGLAATILVEECKVEMVDFSIANADVTLKNNEIIRTVDGGMKRYDGGDNKYGVYFYADNYTLTMEGNTVENLINDKNLIVVQGNYPNHQPSDWNYATKPYRNQITMTGNTLTAKGIVFKVYNDVKYAPVEYPEDYTISTAMKTLANSLFAGNTSGNSATCGTGINDKGAEYSIVAVTCRAVGKSDLDVTEKNSPALFE